MAKYKTCPDCGAALDPGEVCDCRDHPQAPAKPYRPMDKHLAACRRKGQYIQPGFRAPGRAR